MSDEPKVSLFRAWCGGPLVKPEPTIDLSILPSGKSMRPDDSSLDKSCVASEETSVIRPRPRQRTPWDSF